MPQYGVGIGYSYKNKYGYSNSIPSEKSDEEALAESTTDHPSRYIYCRRCGKEHSYKQRCPYCNTKSQGRSKSQESEDEDNIPLEPLGRPNDLEILETAFYYYLPSDKLASSMDKDWQELMRHALLCFRFLEEVKASKENQNESEKVKANEENQNTDAKYFEAEMKKLMEKLPERSPLKKLQEDLLSKTYLIFSYWIENRHLFKQNFSPYTVIATIYWNEEKDEHEYELEKTFEERLGVEKIKGGNKNVAILRKKRLLLAEYLLKTPGMKEFVKILKDKPQSPEQERLAFHHYFRKNPDVYPKKICYDLNPKAKEEDFTIEDTYISRMKEDKYPACFIFSHNSIQQAKPIRRFIGEQGQDPFCKEYLDAVVWETFVDKCPQILEEKDFLVSIEDKVKKKTEEDIKLPPKKLKIPWKEKISTILSAGIITITGDQLSFEPVEIAPIFQDKTSRLLQCLNISQRIISDWVNTEKDKLIKYIKNIFSDKKATRRHIKINDITLDSKIKNDLNREDKNLLDLSLAKIVIKHRK